MFCRFICDTSQSVSLDSLASLKFPSPGDTYQIRALIAGQNFYRTAAGMNSSVSDATDSFDMFTAVFLLGDRAMLGAWSDARVSCKFPLSEL